MTTVQVCVSTFVSETTAAVSAPCVATKFLNGSWGISIALFVVTKPNVYKETSRPPQPCLWLQKWVFLTRPGDISRHICGDKRGIQAYKAHTIKSFT